jgi:tetratricopeptide (TPR) repeat protein
VARQEGDLEEAERRFSSALALRTEIRYPSGIAESLLRLGEVKALRGSEEEAFEHLVEARRLAREIDVPGEVVLAAARLSTLTGGNLEEARKDLAFYGGRLRVEEMMEARYLLYLAGQDTADLARAFELLAGLVENAPAECRESMIQNVPLHRVIMLKGEAGT